MATEKERIESLEKDVSTLKIEMAVAKSEIGTIKDTLTKINSNTTWTIRLIIGAIILALINLILKGGV